MQWLPDNQIIKDNRFIKEIIPYRLSRQFTIKINSLAKFNSAMEMMVGQAHGSNYSLANISNNSSANRQSIEPVSQHIVRNLQQMSKKISGIQQCLSDQKTEKEDKERYCRYLLELTKLAGKCVTSENPAFEQLTIACLSLISICLFKGGRQAINKKDVLKKQLVNIVFACEVDRLLKKSVKVQVALVYLLEVIRPLTPQQNTKRLVQISMQLLRQSQSSLKMNYNLFKLLVQLLPNIDAPTAIRYKMLNLVLERTQRHSSPDIQAFVYRILLHFEQFTYFTQFAQKNLESSINKQQTVGTIVQEMIRIKNNIDSDTILNVLKIIEKYGEPPIAFYELIETVVMRYDVETFISWLQGDTLSNLASKWDTIVSQQQEHVYFSLMSTVFRKCEPLGLDKMFLYRCDIWNFSMQYRQAVSTCRCPKIYKILRQLFFERMKEHLHQF